MMQQEIETQEKKPHKSLYVLPSLFTLANMCFGFFSIIYAFNGKFLHAAKVIVVAVLMDGLDGRIARATKTTSEFGLNFDSIVDVISFGVAPAVLVYAYWFKNMELGFFSWFYGFLFLAAGAARLARFNVQTKKDNASGSYFIGLPIPGAAGLIGVLIWINEIYLLNNSEIQNLWRRLAPALVIILSFLMISRIRYYSFKKIKYLYKFPILLIIFSAAFLFVLIKFPALTLLAIGVIYVFSGPVRATFSLAKAVTINKNKLKYE